MAHDAGQPGFDSRHGQEIFLHSIESRPALGSTQPPTQWVPRALSPGIKRPGCEAGNSLPSTAEVENGGSILTLPVCLHGVVPN
jgi:hypothetical protein